MSVNLDSAPTARLWLVVPCYNEAARITPGPFLDFLRAQADAALLFVDDGSTDGTGAALGDLAERACGRARVLSLPRNVGKAAAVREGVLASLALRPELVGFWDSDLATPLTAVPGFLEILARDSRIDIVIGSRVKLLGRDIRRSGVRHYVGRVFATGASLALGLAVYDTQCGAKIFRTTDAIAGVFQAPFRSSWVFDVEILARYVAIVGRVRAEAGIYELPLMAWSDVPGSKVRAWHGIRAAYDLARMRSWAKQPGAGR